MSKTIKISDRKFKTEVMAPAIKDSNVQEKWEWNRRDEYTTCLFEKIHLVGTGQVQNSLNAHKDLVIPIPDLERMLADIHDHNWSYKIWNSSKFMTILYGENNNDPFEASTILQAVFRAWEIVMGLDKE